MFVNTCLYAQIFNALFMLFACQYILVYMLYLFTGIDINQRIFNALFMLFACQYILVYMFYLFTGTVPGTFCTNEKKNVLGDALGD